MTQANQKKNQVIVHKTPNAYLSVAILGQVKTNNAIVFSFGVLDAKGRMVPIGKTNPQRRLTPENGELVRISVDAISKRDDNGTIRYGLSNPNLVSSKSIPAKPSTMKDIEKLFEQGK